MNKVSVYLLTVIFLSSAAARAQDRIYFPNEIKDGKVTDITADKIKFRNMENPGSVYSVSRNKVLLVFNNAGEFLVIPSLDDAGNKSSSMIREFLQPPVNTALNDKLVTLQNFVIYCHIDREDDNNVYYTSGNHRKTHIEKSSLALIIYKDGRHVLLTEISQAVPVLSKVQDQINPPIAEAAAVKQVAPAPSNQHNTADQTSLTAEPKIVSKETSSATEKPVASPAPRKDNNAAEDLEAVSFRDYEKKALQKTEDLSAYLKILCDKNTNWQEADKAIDQAVALFINEDATVQTSTIGKEGKTNYKIRDYLKRLKLIKYDKVQIEWTNIQYVSKLRKGIDGNYYGIISFEQVFKGYIENSLIYSDKTRKNVEVVLKAYNRNSNGKTQISWDVLLSDIGVRATKA
ncbi:MAG: hypothetical protein Q8926_11185 [Bacteroidota bacterium]|nr:hypothetical protein [Bacteroidota bacterium]